MPSLLEQHQALGQSFPAPFCKSLRALQQTGRPLPEMRKETVSLIRQAEAVQIRSHVLVNNRSEGSAPLTVQALVDQLESKR